MWIDAVFWLALYFLPALIGWRRGVLALGNLVMLNALLGWTLIGWIWLASNALTDRTHDELARLYGMGDDGR
jgi:hypothetical protein